MPCEVVPPNSVRECAGLLKNVDEASCNFDAGHFLHGGIAVYSGIDCVSGDA